MDLNSTIIRLFDLDYEHLLGVNVFSDEASFAIDPKTMDLITDSFFFGFKNQKYKLYTHIDKKMMNEEIKIIKRFKIANDNFLIKKLMS